MVLAERQTHRPTERSVEPRNKPLHMCQMIFDKSAKIHSVGERTVFSTDSAGKLDGLMQRNEAEHLPHTIFKKTNSKSIKHLNIKPKTIKLLEENIGKKLHNTGFSNDFLDVTPASKRKTQTN